MQDVIIGKYRLSKTENFDAFLAEIGLGYIKRKLAQSTSPEITISRSGDRWTMVTSSALSTSQVSFVLGEDFAEDRQDGVSVTSRVTADDDDDDEHGRSNTWTQTQKPGDGKDVTIVREFGDKELKVTSTVNGVTAHRVYERLGSGAFSTLPRCVLLSARKMQDIATKIRHSSTSELGLCESRSRAAMEMMFKIVAWEKGIALQHLLLPEIGPYSMTKKRAASPLEKEQ
ncbi:hypothetical protein ARSEF4850_003674 [Beauveria asiatica]